MTTIPFVNPDDLQKLTIYRGFGWYGGKARLAKNIISLIPEHTTWMEPFAGGLSVTLTKPVSPIEIINDKDSSVIHIYKTLQNPATFAEFYDRVKKLKYAELVFLNAREKNRYHIYADEIDRAVNTFIEITMSFSALRTSFSKGETTEQYQATISKQLPEVSKRLRNVIIKNEDALELLKCVDKNTLCYLDPPYVPSLLGSNNTYAQNMDTVEQIQMLRKLPHLEGKLILSGYRNKEGIDLYDRYLLPHGFRVYRLATTYKACQHKRNEKKSKAEEIVWCNFPLPESALIEADITDETDYIYHKMEGGAK